MSDLDADAAKAIAWAAYREAWNEQGSTSTMSELDERTARTAFERWWNQR